VGLLAEHFADEKGLVWPDNVAPFKVYLARLSNDGVVVDAAEELYKSLTSAGITVLYDDSERRPGEKFADADLMGIPHRVVVSTKTVESGKHEHKHRTESGLSMLSSDEIIKTLS
jgi:prolyl-tRNA synthetase